jgi:hypothetical protein
MDLLRVALIWIGLQIAGLTIFLQGVAWAAITGAMTGGSDWWDTLANYDMVDWGHTFKIMAPAMFASISQWVVSQNSLKAKLAEQALDYERKLREARS